MENEDNVTVRDALDYLQAGDSLAFKRSIDDLLHDRALEAIEVEKAEIGRKFFGQPDTNDEE